MQVPRATIRGRDLGTTVVCVTWDGGKVRRLASTLSAACLYVPLMDIAALSICFLSSRIDLCFHKYFYLFPSPEIKTCQGLVLVAANLRLHHDRLCLYHYLYLYPIHFLWFHLS